jgi:acyl-CoA synthetase (AMP-forming)/AMP-acid ligase II
LYFVDRLGDTFRWKSENVSTNEVSDMLGLFPQIAEANVYGVQVPKADGRCGCAAVVFANGVSESNADFKGLAKHALASMPRYAVPVFLRITPALEYTGTLKMQKGRLRQQGADPKLVTDQLYWLPPGKDEYVPFGLEDYKRLESGELKL